MKELTYKQLAAIYLDPTKGLDEITNEEEYNLRFILTEGDAWLTIAKHYDARYVMPQLVQASTADDYQKLRSAAKLPETKKLIESLHDARFVVGNIGSASITRLGVLYSDAMLSETVEMIDLVRDVRNIQPRLGTCPLAEISALESDCETDQYRQLVRAKRVALIEAELAKCSEARDAAMFRELLSYARTDEQKKIKDTHDEVCVRPALQSEDLNVLENVPRAYDAQLRNSVDVHRDGVMLKGLPECTSSQDFQNLHETMSTMSAAQTVRSTYIEWIHERDPGELVDLLQSPTWYLQEALKEYVLEHKAKS